MPRLNSFRGDRLEKLRRLHGFTQEEFAERINASQVQVWRYETGKADPSSEILTRIAQELQVTADYLLGLVNDPGAHLSARDLSPDESRLLDAYRRGDLRGLMRLIADSEQPTTQKPHEAPVSSP